ncbi:DUF3883 domain-containing protein [Rathayibacter sp. AY1F9]|uniref:DUF3883 domain-containing protein n=1 Tax=Rathayibacter sp. AY1F9 TaxID=2080563 RepID=UPI0015E48305|nr:DUF3883 domain-containing protein [Rathayibacter sp. AY1F9]
MTNHLAYSDLSPGQYSTALNWLNDAKVFEAAEPGIPSANLILDAILEVDDPLWFRDFDILVRSPDELPTDFSSAGGALGLSELEVYQQVQRKWGKVDAAARAQIGAAGEEALVALLKDAPGCSVDHVSTWSDGFGYDIAFSRDKTTAHLEVKTTTRTGRFVAYLSRHESDVMRYDEHWYLILVRMTDQLALTGVGWVAREWIAANLPQDGTRYGTWASCKLDVPPEAIKDGFPVLGDDICLKAPPWDYSR